MVDWLIDYCFMSNSRIFHLYGDVTITGERLQNLDLCLAPRAFEQGGIFILPHLLWHGASVFPVSSEAPPHLVAFYDTQGDVENLFSPGFSRFDFSHEYSLWQNLTMVTKCLTLWLSPWFLTYILITWTLAISFDW
jgi:hypothetical protein